MIAVWLVSSDGPYTGIFDLKKIGDTDNICDNYLSMWRFLRNRRLILRLLRRQFSGLSYIGRIARSS